MLHRYYIFCAVQVLCVDGVDTARPPHRPQSPFCKLIGRRAVNHKKRRHTIGPMRTITAHLLVTVYVNHT